MLLKENTRKFIRKYIEPFSNKGILPFIFGFLCCYIVLNTTRRKDQNLEIFAPVVTPHKTIPPGPRILCIISTHPDNWQTKVVHVVSTWSGRCDHVVFTTPRSGQVTQDVAFWNKIVIDPRFNVIMLNATSSRKDLWKRLKQSFIYVNKEYKDKFDFVVKCDDDTYIVMENLKHRLQSLSSSERLLLGHEMYDQETRFMSGGSGMVISRAGFKAIVEEGFLSENKPCDLPVKNKKQLKGQIDDDLQVGACAQLLNLKFYSSEDEEERKITFFPFKLENYLVPSLIGSWWDDIGLECRHLPSHQCPSSYPVAFHYVTPKEMYKLEYLLYSAKLH